MLPIKIKDGVASLNINVSKKLTPRQLATLTKTGIVQGEAAKDRYLASLVGLIKENVRIERPEKAGFDRLANRREKGVLSKFKELLDCCDNVRHRPSMRKVGHWVGVEIECIYPCDKIEEDNGSVTFEPSEDDIHFDLRDSIIKAKIPRASVKYDGSLSDEEGLGVEITLLFNTEDGFGPLERLCEVLHNHGCYVNETCGLHVHLDMRHLKTKDVRIIGRRLGRALPVLKYMVHKSRHNNEYCDMGVSKFKEDTPRYYAINMTSYFKYKTIEVRMHGGSTNPNKIRNWIELIKFIGSSKVSKSFATFQDLIDLGTPEHLIAYADKRISKLNPEAWVKLMPPEPQPKVVTPQPQVDAPPPPITVELGVINE